MKKAALFLVGVIVYYSALVNEAVSSRKKAPEDSKEVTSEIDWYLGSKSVAATSILIVTTNTPTICPGSNGSATLTSTSCEPSEVIQWYIGSSNVSFTSGNTSVPVTPSSTTTYRAKCTNSSNAVVVTSNNLTITIPTISTPSSVSKNPSVNVSPGTSVTLTANGCSASGNSVKWENNSTTNPRVVAPSISTTYSFKCVYGSCESTGSASTTVTVLPPAPIITTNLTTICPGGSVTLSSTLCENPNVVEWFLGSASVSFTSGSSSIVVNPSNSSTAYIAKCTGESGTSSSSNTINIAVTPVNIPSNITVSPSNMVGPNTNVSLTANGCGSNTVKWEDNSTTNPRVILPLVTALYSFKCVNGACESGGNASTTITFQPCPNSITLVNPTNDINSGPKTYQASASTGTIEASNKIMGSGTAVTYNAGKSITLNQGFLADNTTIFIAEIGGCN